MPLTLMPNKDDTRGQHPNSLKNLEGRGRKSHKIRWGEETKNRGTTTTLTGWQGFDKKVKAANFENRSDFIEHAGRGLTPILDKKLDINDLNFVLEQQGFQSLSEVAKSLISGECELIKK